MERRPLEEGKAIAKDVWQQLRSQAGESGAFSGIRETMERIMGRLKVGTVFALLNDCGFKDLFGVCSRFRSAQLRFISR